MCGIWGLFGSDTDVHEQVINCFEIAHRGSDCFRVENVIYHPNCLFGFHRLAINDGLNGMQPIRITSMSHIWMIYNGEIYNYKELGAKYDFKYTTGCDGESLIHLYNKGGIQFMCENLYGVFAFILFDTKLNRLYFGRDTYGVRPLFKLHTPNGTLAICSEAKGLLRIKGNDYDGVKKFNRIGLVQPGTYEEYALNPKTAKARHVKVYRYHHISALPRYDVSVNIVEDDIYENIRNCLSNAVKMRLMSERRIGCLLSGGLDSSLISGLMVSEARKAGIKYPIQTFSIGMSSNSPDLVAARKVAKHLNTEHYEVTFSFDEAFDSLRKVIRALESYDITSIRASIGMYLLSKFINEKTDTIVIFSGEGSDEVCQGYIYFHKAPSPEAAHEESLRLSNDLHLYDLCRADRMTVANGLELRVPFLDHFFTSYYFSLDPNERCIKESRCEKYLLRKAFDNLNIIPQDILWRPKEAFSDGVSDTEKSFYKYLQERIEPLVSDEEMAKAAEKYPLNTPHTKEAYYYREIFTEFYPNCEHFTPYLWMPKWCGNVTDPSARTLDHYNTAIKFE